MREAVRQMDELDEQLESEMGSSSAGAKVTTAPVAPPMEVDPELLHAVEDIDILHMPHMELPTILNQTFESNMYTDMQFPLRDREFVEAFVRIVAEASCRKHGGGVSGSGLFDNVYRMLAETVSFHFVFIHVPSNPYFCC